MYFSGKVSDATINLTRELSVKNLTSEINFMYITDVDAGIDYEASIIKSGSIYDLEINRH